MAMMSGFLSRITRNAAAGVSKRRQPSAPQSTPAAPPDCAGGDVGAAALAAAEPADTGEAVDKEDAVNDADGAVSGGAVVAAAAGALVGWLLQPLDAADAMRRTTRLRS